MESSTKYPVRIEVVDDQMATIFRQMTPRQKFKMMSSMYGSAKRMIGNHLRSENPHWTAEQVDLETLKRLSHGN